MTGAALCNVVASRVHKFLVNLSLLFAPRFSGEGPKKKESMPAQDYNEDLTELMKESPTMSWVLEGDKGKTCNRIIHEFSSLR